MARKNVTPLRPIQSDPAADKLNEAHLRLTHARAIADLVAHSNHDELYEWTIVEAMYVVMEEVERAQELVSGVLPHMAALKEVANG
jgi:hypothetical protein